MLVLVDHADRVSARTLAPANPVRSCGRGYRGAASTPGPCAADQDLDVEVNPHVVRTSRRGLDRPGPGRTPPPGLGAAAVGGVGDRADPDRWCRLLPGPVQAPPAAEPLPSHRVGLAVACAGSGSNAHHVRLGWRGLCGWYPWRPRRCAR